jgi:predicted alpha/beta superfamily hydrolase
MQDGQNLFDLLYCFSDEWGIDESMDNLASVFSPKAIIIGIDNGGINRINEYSPWVDATYGGGQGDAYVSFICNTLKPFIDSHFRTLPDRENTGIMGSSMGGLISFYGALKHQDIFSKAGIFSPSFWFSDSIYNFISSQGHLQDMKIYFMCGGQEGGTMVSDMQNVYDSLLLHGFSASEMNFQTRADGQHSEWFWQREYPSAYEWLFTSMVTGIENVNKGNDIDIYPQPASTAINITTQPNDIIEIYNIDGQIMKRITAGENYTTIDISGFARGLYVMKVKSSSLINVRKFVKE